MKKEQQLGMNPSTASGRLVKDLLYDFIVKCGKNNCYHCGKPMTRDSFSIEHVEPWLDSDDPVGKFFDLNNISYSHKICNIKAGRKPEKIYNTPQERNAAKRPYDKLRVYDPEKRKEQYRRHNR